MADWQMNICGILAEHSHRLAVGVMLRFISPIHVEKEVMP